MGIKITKKYIFRILLTIMAFSSATIIQGNPDSSKIIISQERVWTSIDGRQITARAVSKNPTSVTLKNNLGKRVEVELSKLSKEDLEWIKMWSPPSIVVTAYVETVYTGTKNIEMRKFVFYSPLLGSIEVYEKKLPYLIPVLKKSLDYEKVDKSDIANYNHDIPYEKLIGYDGEPKNAVFSVRDGKSHLILDESNKIRTETIPMFIDYIEIFSVTDWDKKQEEIKQRFK